MEVPRHLPDQNKLQSTQVMNVKRIKTRQKLTLNRITD